VKNRTKLAISIVSHNQIKLVYELLHDIQAFCSSNFDLDIEIILTINISENLIFNITDFLIPIKIIENISPRGFGENHNAALKNNDSEFFCILNPDIRLLNNPFNFLLKNFNDLTIGVLAPCITDSFGNIQDSARKFPTPWSILNRALLNKHTPDYLIEKKIINPDWVAGMCMLFRAEVFKKLNGFDERFFLYCEDIDICARVRLLNYRVILDPRVSVIHNAQRDSHKSWRYLKWHISSLLRFFYKRYLGYY